MHFAHCKKSGLEIFRRSKLKCLFFFLADEQWEEIYLTLNNFIFGNFNSFLVKLRTSHNV